MGFAANTRSGFHPNPPKDFTMGVFNHFRDLKDHADKLVRFKQDVSIRAADDAADSSSCRVTARVT